MHSSSPPLPPAQTDLLEVGTPPFDRANSAMFIGGFTTFALLYATQPLLPRLATEFGVGAATASLSVSVGTGLMALMLIPASLLSDRFGRTVLMKASLSIAAVIATLSAFVTDFNQLLVLRALLGAALAGLPAAAMAYLGEEVAPHAQGRAMGLYIAGNALGGMSGRVVSGVLTDFGSWRISLIALGLIGLVAAIAFWRKLPPSRHFRPRSVAPSAIFRDVRGIYADSHLPLLFLCGFLLMGAFFGVYNFIGFRLEAVPFGLSQSAIAAIFLLYLVGSASSAWSGRLSDRVGRHNVLWLMIIAAMLGLATTLSGNLILVIIGVAIFTFGYFGAHTTASGWVGRRALERRALASALYLSSYYLGSSLVGSLTGLAWDKGGWPGVTMAVSACLAAALVLGVWMRAKTLTEKNG